MTDIVERLRRKVFHGPTMEASHTKTVEWQAADEIERLRAALHPFADESIWSGPQHEFVTVKRSDCDNARSALNEEENK